MEHPGYKDIDGYADENGDIVAVHIESAPEPAREIDLIPQFDAGEPPTDPEARAAWTADTVERVADQIEAAGHRVPYRYVPASDADRENYQIPGKEFLGRIMFVIESKIWIGQEAMCLVWVDEETRATHLETDRPSRSYGRVRNLRR